VSRLTSRPFADESDLHLLLDFARDAAVARLPGPTCWHPGDVVWQLIGTPGVNPAEDIHLWLDDGGIAGLAWFEPPLIMQFDVRPGFNDSDGLIETILEWAESRRHALGRPAPGATPRAYAMLGQTSLSTVALDSDARRIAALEAHGYVRTERHGLRYRRGLEIPIPEGPLPAGMRLRHATDSDIDQRVELHRDAWSVWGPSSANPETYRMLRAAPVYEPELDVIVEGPDGRLLSYCICWADPVTGVGEFEPVGTRPAFAGRGLARAAIYEGMRRLRARGMHTAIVGTASVNERALRLYPSCGFEAVDRDRFYEKRIL
jgi:ribosomal protein S18 acetylase RimI-like enzyme